MTRCNEVILSASWKVSYDRFSGNHLAGSMLSYVRQALTIVIISGVMLALVVIGGCDSGPQNWQDAHGWVTNCTGLDFSRFSSGALGGPGPDRPVFKIKDQFVLAVPKQNWPSTSAFESPPRECRHFSDLPTAHYLHFVVSGKWSAGYQPEDVLRVNGQPQFTPDIATVRIEPQIPDALPAEERKKINEIGNEVLKNNFNGKRDIGALTCYVPLPPNTFSVCSGKRSASDPEIVSLRYRDYAATPFFLVQAAYNSSRYGGVTVNWQAWILDVSNALKIDAAIWELVDSWDLKAKTQSPEHGASINHD